MDNLQRYESIEEMKTKKVGYLGTYREEPGALIFSSEKLSFLSKGLRALYWTYGIPVGL